MIPCLLVIFYLVLVSWYPVQYVEWNIFVWLFQLIVDLMLVYQNYFTLFMSRTLYISVLPLNPLLNASVEPFNSNVLIVSCDENDNIMNAHFVNSLAKAEGCIINPVWSSKSQNARFEVALNVLHLSWCGLLSSLLPPEPRTIPLFSSPQSSQLNE